jgi:hypothetical protein
VSNRIIEVRLEERSLDPASAELWVTVRPERLTPSTEVRGRLVGPNCAFASTVEVAYPLRPLRPEQQQPGAFRFRVAIPEPSLWDTQSPFLYAGPVELWQDGQRCDRTQLSHGLRQVALGPQGLRVNGRPTSLLGRSMEHCDPSLPGELRRAGVNLMVLPVREELLWCWYAAAVNGIFVLGRLAGEEAANDTQLRAAARLPSCLGWLVPRDRVDLAERLRGPRGPFVGVEGAEQEGADLLLRRDDGRTVLSAGGVHLGVVEDE